MTTEQCSTPKARPAIPSWIQPNLFETVFKQIFTNFKQIKDFKVEPALNPGENYASIVLRLHMAAELKDGSSQTTTLIMKTAVDSEKFREVIKNYNIFESETIMYRKVIPELEQLYRDVGVELRFAPKSYELDIEHPCILLEDLGPRGFKTINRLEGLDMKHTHAILTLLAQWHAASVVRAAKQKYFQSIIPEASFREENREMLKTIMDGLGAAFLKCAKSYKGAEMYYDILCQNLGTRLDAMMAANKLDESEFNVLNHGDLWSNNIMFKYDDSGEIADTYFVDYQIPHFGSPAQDLYYILLSSTQYELKITEFDNFVKFYHSRLLENLKLLKYSKRMPTLEDIHNSLYKYKAWAYNSTTGVMTAVLMDPSDKANMENYTSDSTDALQFKIQLYSNPRYRKHIEALLPWMYHRGLL